MFWDCPGKPFSQGARQTLCAGWAGPRGLAQVAWPSRFWRQAAQPLQYRATGAVSGGDPRSASEAPPAR